jgi:hypothetical protein
MASRSLRNRTIDPMPDSENSVSDWPTDGPEELKGLSEPVASIAHSEVECTKSDKTSDYSAIQPTTASEHAQNKDEEIKDFTASIFSTTLNQVMLNIKYI